MPHRFSEKSTAAWHSECFAGIAPGQRGPDVPLANAEGKFGRFYDRFSGHTQIRAAIDAFVQYCNQAAIPFEWRAETVCPTKLNSRYRDLRK